RSAWVAENFTSSLAASNRPSSMATITGRWNTWLLGAMRTTGFCSSDDMGASSFVRVAFRFSILDPVMTFLNRPLRVMAWLVPAIHVLLRGSKVVDARHEARQARA